MSAARNRAACGAHAHPLPPPASSGGLPYIDWRGSSADLAAWYERAGLPSCAPTADGGCATYAVLDTGPFANWPVLARPNVTYLASIDPAWADVPDLLPDLESVESWEETPKWAETLEFLQPSSGLLVRSTPCAASVAPRGPLGT